MCMDADPRALPAVVPNYEVAQNLGRHMLIGRPSLENAWIGARWTQQYEYAFESENKVLGNATDEKTKYPPWRNNTMIRPGGCILLDRHLSDITYFVEARCIRNRPYICYMIDDNETANASTWDVIFGSRGYRMHYDLQPWYQALRNCRDKYDEKAKLVELTDGDMVNEMLFVMGENRSTVQHTWIAGVFDDNKWLWGNNNNTNVDTDFVKIIGNATSENWIYEHDVENENICLNMDRENHATALFYGTRCSATQTYVCLFGKLHAHTCIVK